MPTSNPKKISILAPPPGNTTNAKPQPEKRKERNPDPHAAENQRVTIVPRSGVEEFRETVNSGVKAAKGAVDAIDNYGRKPVELRTTTPRGGVSGAGGGSGGGGGDELAFAAEAIPAPPLAFAAEAMRKPARMAAPSAGPAFAAESIQQAPGQRAQARPMAGSGYPQGSVQDTLFQGLLAPQSQPPQLRAQASVKGAQPYRESDGPRRFAVRREQPSFAASPAAPLLNRVSTTGYSPGVLATRERQKAQQELAGLNLPAEAHAAAMARIQQGDVGVVNRAALAVSQVPSGAMNNPTVKQYLAQQLLGEGAQQFDAGRQADLGHYRQVAQRNTDAARAGSAQAQRLGLSPIAQQSDGAYVANESKLQAALRANLGLVDSATIRRMMADDPSNGALRPALAQAIERERKHAENTTRNQAKLDQTERDRKAADGRLDFEREWILKDLETRGRAGSGRGGVQGADDTKQMNDAYRDYLRAQPMNPLSRDDFQRQYWDGYSPGLLGRVEEMGYDALSSLVDVAGAPLRAAAALGPGMGHTPPGDSRFPNGLPQAAPGVAPVPTPDQQATPIPQPLMHPPANVQPMAWNQALSHLADLTPEQRAAFNQKGFAEQQRLLMQSIGM